MRRRDLLLIIAVAFAAAGCVSPTPQPPLSSSKFLRNPGGSSGKAGFATGIAVQEDLTEENDEDEATSVFAFATEGFVDVPLSDRYDLSLTTTFPVGTLEGVFWAVAGPSLSLGIIHGLGLSVVEFADDPTVFLTPDIGVVLQAGESVPVLVSLRGAQGFVPMGEDDEFHGTTHVVGTVEFVPTKSPIIVPGVSVLYSTFEEEREFDTTLEFESLTVLVGASVAADF